MKNILNTEVTSLIDQGKHYYDLYKVAHDLGLDDIDVENC